MERKAASGIVLTLLLASMLILAFNVQLVKAEGTIYIRPDGTVDPSTAPINRVGDVYTFTSDIYQPIVVEADNIVIDGNGYTLQGHGYGYGFYLYGRSGVTVKNVTVRGWEYGIKLDGSSNNSIYGNNITANYFDGIQLFSSSHNSIYGNNLAANGFAGILLNDSQNNSISGNNITANGWYGGFGNIGLGDGSSNNSICGNNITASWHAIFLLYCSNNNIIGNNIANNYYDGIWLYWSSSNTIYHNNFIDNAEQVYSYASTNAWDDGYPSGGNYWSDYTGVDANGDGIGETPYIIDADNSDQYPFVNPWSDTTPPVADAGPDQTVYEDTLMTFDGSGSSDNVGIVSYVWTFVDVTPQTLTGMIPAYTFTTLGIYTVTLDVSDPAGNHATDTVTITVLPLTPENLIQGLIETIDTWNLPYGTENSLTSKLDDALHLLAIGNENGAIHKLMEFMSQIEALRDKKLYNDQADYLVSEAQRIIDLING